MLFLEEQKPPLAQGFGMHALVVVIIVVVINGCVDRNVKP